MLRQYINKHFIVVRRAFVLLSLFILGIAFLSSCQIEKRQYVRGFFINKTACEFDSNKRAMDTRDTLMIPQTSEIELLEQIEPMIEINSENTLALANETGSNELCAQPFIKSQNKQFFKWENRLACKHQKNIKDCFGSNRVYNDEPKKFHPLAKLAFAILLFDIVVAEVLPRLFIVSGYGWLIFFFGLPIGAIILLIIARSKTKNNPDKWTGLGCITASIIILTFIGLLAILNLWLLFS